VNKNNYNHIAFIYDALVTFVFGSQLIKAQTHFFSQLPKEANILFIGGGTGKVLPELLSIAQPSTIDYVELSAKMMSIAQKRCLQQKNIQFIQEDFCDFISNEKYDVIITFFFLDLFKDQKINTLIQKINDNLSTDGIWLFTDFVDTGHYRLIHKVFIKLMYAFFRLFTHVDRNSLPDFLAHINKHTFHSHQKKSFFNKLISSYILKPKK